MDTDVSGSGGGVKGVGEGGDEVAVGLVGSWKFENRPPLNRGVSITESLKWRIRRVRVEWLRADFTAEEIIKVLEADGELSCREMVRPKLHYLVHGVVIGNEGFAGVLLKRAGGTKAQSPGLQPRGMVAIPSRPERTMAFGWLHLPLASVLLGRGDELTPLLGLN